MATGNKQAGPKKGRAKQISTEETLRIVELFACFRRPRDVARMVKEEFGRVIDPAQMSKLTLDTATGRKGMPDRWRAYFEERRKRFIEDVASVPVSNLPVRLQAIQATYEAAADAGNHVLVLQALEQAAKEVGNVFTNRQHLEHSGVPVVVVKDFTGRPPEPAGDAAAA